MNIKQMAGAAGLVLASAAGPVADETPRLTAIDHRPFVATYLVKRKPGMTFEAFRTHQLQSHVPLALALPGLIDYRLTFFPPDGDTPQAFDAMAQVSFASVEAHERALASPTGQTALGDLANMLDMEQVRIVAAGPGDFFAAKIAGD